MAKYSPEFKLNVVREYADTTIGITRLADKYGLSEGMLRRWWQHYQVHGAKAFQKKYSTYSAQFKRQVLQFMQAQQLSLRETAAHFDLRGGTGVVSRWQRLYDEGGIKALEPHQRGRPKTVKTPPKKTKKNLSPEEQALKKLQREVEYLRAENAYLKKWDDVLRQKEPSLKTTSNRKKRRKSSSH